MRHRPLAVLVALWLAAATGAHAGTLTAATWTTGIGFLGPFQPSSVGFPVAATGTSTSSSISVLASVAPTTFTTFATGAALHLTLEIGGAASLTATPNGAAATMSIPAHATVKTAFHDKFSKSVPGRTVVKAPIGVGVNGQSTNSFTLFGLVHFLTVDFYGWTPGTISFTGLTSGYYALTTPTVVGMGSFALDAMGAGTVTLVAPTRLSIDGSLAQRRAVDFTELRLTFVPEPSTLLLLAAGAAGLGLVARRRPD